MSRYPNNTVANYVTHLSNPIELEGRWEMSVVEVHYPHTIFNVSKNRNYIYWKSDIDDIPHYLYVKPGLYTTAATLIKAINVTMVKNNLGFFVFAFTGKGPQGNTVVSYEPEKESGVNQVQIVQVTLCDSLARQLGYARGVNLLDFPTGTVDPDPTFGQTSHIYLYCDIVAPQIIGDTMAPILRMINTDYKKYNFGENVTKSFVTLQYVPLMKNHFSTIEMDLRDSFGHLVPFGFGISSVTLHFRRILNGQCS
jgi:hypothetical protein